MFTSDVIKARNVHVDYLDNVIYHKFSHGAAFYTLNGKNVNVMLELFFFVLFSFFHQVSVVELYRKSYKKHIIIITTTRKVSQLRD